MDRPTTKPTLTFVAGTYRRTIETAVVTLARSEAVAVGATLSLFGLIVARLVAIGSVFGPDETAYAIAARAWVEGTPMTGWSPHHAPLLSILGTAAVPLGDVEASMRVIGLLAGLTLVLTVWRLAGTLGGAASGVLAALVVAGIPDLQLNSSFFLTDVPAAAMLLLVVLLVWKRLELAEGRGSFLGIALAAAAAFYFRYSSAVPILLIGLTSILIWPAALLGAWRRVLVAVALFVLMLVPHVVFAVAVTGSPWRIATLALAYAAPTYPGQGLVTYLGAFPSSLAGPAAALVITVGVASWVIAIARGQRHERRARGATLLVLPALADVAIIGFTSLPQTRFVYFPIACLIVAGSVALVTLWRRIGAARAAVATATVVTLVTLILGSGLTNLRNESRSAPRQRFIVEASHAIRDDAAGRSCSVLTYLNAFVTWYSRCATVTYGFPPVPGREQLLTGQKRYVLLLSGLDPLGHGFAAGQPSGDVLQRYLRIAEPVPFAVIRDPRGGAIAARIYRLKPPSPGDSF